MTRLLCLTVLLATPALSARTTAPRSVAELTAESTAVVLGTVELAVTTRSGPDVRTTYTVAPIRALSGTAPAAVVMELPGGRVGEALVQATGVPVWSVGDEVVVFLNGTRPTSLDGLLTVRQGIVVDPHHRPVEAMPNDLTTLAAELVRPELERPR